MSRLIVKNLPMKVTQEQVTAHFSQFGQVTDVRLKYKKSGEFRGFAFIGYDSEEAADKALNQLCNTFFKKNKIIVEKCLEFDHKEKMKAAEKKSENNIKSLSIKNQNREFKFQLKKKDEMTKEKLETLMENPNFIQYLKLNRRGAADLVDTLKKKYGSLKLVEDERDKGNLKEKDEDEEEEKKKEKEEEEPKEENLANKNISDIEYLQCLMKTSTEKLTEQKKKKVKPWKNLFTVVVRTKEQQTNKEKKEKTLTKKLIKEFFRPLTIQSLRIPRTMSFVAYVGFKTERAMNKALQNDKSFLDGVRVRIRKRETRDPSGNTPNEEETPWKAAEDRLSKEAEPVAESGKLFVRNLWYSVSEKSLRKLFEKIGPLADITLPISKLTQRPKGFAHVTYVLPEHAVKAMCELDGQYFNGRVLHILPSLKKEEEEDTEGKSYQKKKKEEMKKKPNSWHDWNSLFIGSGAVIDLMAQKNKISKYKMFEDDNDTSAAVSMALSEAQIVEETKRMLEENDVCLDAFSNPNMQRSSTVILSKNLPANTAASELKEIFGKFGELGRLVLPPSGVTAIIEFMDPSDAKKAYKNLIYTRFKYLPLYLEWAPFEVFSSPPTKQSPPEEKAEKDKDNESKTSENKEPEENTTLYVKNLNFKTDEESLINHFSHMGEICSALIAKRRMLSQGYGFVQFFKASDANKALRLLQNTSLDGHELTLKKSEKKLVEESSKGVKMVLEPGEPTSAVILIRNIPFQATFKEVSDLFQPAGEIKMLRLPKKFASTEHRGFGFIEYMTREEAKKAMRIFGASTHLYGRRLVLEWANEEETVEQKRSRTAEKFIASGPPKKKVKLDVESEKS